MRNEIHTDKIGRPIRNKVLVEIEDTFEQITTKSGIVLPNLTDVETWADSRQYNISEFIPRQGKVVSLPEIITPGSFDYQTEAELQVNDVCYWNLVSFKSHIPIVCGEKKYLLVDYHEIICRVRDGVITPINGYCMLSPVSLETNALKFTRTEKITEKWKIHTMPEKMPTELNPRYFCDTKWEVGDVVYIKVYKSPFKLEGDIVRHLSEPLYAILVRMILAEA
jgi:co-chaperonin GroES (HSP10)